MASLSINFLYDTQTLLAALEKISTPVKFLRETFFPMTNFSSTEFVELDFRKTGRVVAPIEDPLQGPAILQRQGFNTETYRAPVIAGARVLDVQTILKRWAGENPFTTRTPAERAAEIIRTDLLELDTFISRSEEIAAANVLLQGGAFDGNGNFQSYGTLQTFTPTVKWDATTGATILNDLRTMYDLVGKTGLIWPNMVVLSPEIFHVFRDDPLVQNAFRVYNQYAPLIGVVAPEKMSDNVYFAGHITEPALDVYIYRDYFLNGSNVNTNILDPKKLIMGSNKGNGKFLYGAVSQIEDVNTGEFVTYAESTRVPQVVADKKTNVRTLNLRSRFLAAHPDITEYVVGNVLT